METQKTQQNTEGGNNQTPSESVKSEVKTSYRCRKWVFTLNNYTETDVVSVQLYLNGSALKWIFGREVGKEGTPHLQGYMEFKNAKDWCTIINLCEPFSRAFSSKAKGTLEQNYDYTSKQGDFYYGGFNPKKLKYKVEIENLYNWEQDICNLLEETPHDRHIYWYWEPVGCAGKTTFQKYVFTHYKNVCILSGKSTDMKNGVVEFVKKNGETPDIVLINIPRSVEHVSYEGIESIKDMFFFSGKYEGGQICGPSPHVIIFSNKSPPEAELSADRWKIKRIKN